RAISESESAPSRIAGRSYRSPASPAGVMSAPLYVGWRIRSRRLLRHYQELLSERHRTERAQRQIRLDEEAQPYAGSLYRIGHEPRLHVEQLESVQLQGLADARVAEGDPVVEVIPVFVSEVADVRTHEDESSARP